MFEYFSPAEAEQYSFFRIPKALFSKDYPIYKNISTEAKLLYGLMLDRMSLSKMNNWFDDKNRVYIFFTVEDAGEQLNCGRDKTMKLFAELDGKKGIGLIERKKQGLGKPSVIYVKNCVIKGNFQKSEKPTSKKSEKSTSGSLENRPLEVGISDPNKTEYNKTDSSNNLSYQSNEEKRDLTGWDGKKENNNGFESEIYQDIEQLEEDIRQRIEYDYLCEVTHANGLKQFDKAKIDELVMLIMEMYLSKKKTLRVNSEEVQTSWVHRRLDALKASHIEYVLETLHENTTKVTNIRAYLMTAIYNAPTTLQTNFQADFNNSYYGGGK